MLVVAGCGSTVPAPSLRPSPQPSAAPSAQPPASPSPPGTVAPSESLAPSPNLHGAPELEDRLPDRAATVVLSKVSLTGEDFYAIGTSVGQGQVDSLLAELDAVLADLSVAQAADPGGHLVLQIGVFRIKGVDPTRLLDAWVSSQQAAMRNRLQVSLTDVAGRHLARLLDPSRDVGGSTYAFAVGDTIYLVLADDADLLAEVLAGLP
jgi:hypothetical protein